MPNIEAIHDTQRELLRNHLRKYAPDHIVNAMIEIPRHIFLPNKFQRNAYLDEPYQLEGYQFSSASQPHVMAQMTSLLDPKPDQHILEIGTGSGYQSAVLGKLAGHVTTVEIQNELAQMAHYRHNQLGIQNVSVVIADGGGSFEDETFDGVMTTAAQFPNEDTLTGYNELKYGGIYVAPIGGVNGEPNKCEIMKIVKNTDGPHVISAFPGFDFHPDLGSKGWNTILNMLIRQYYGLFLDGMK